jgi:hypothetical protein
MTEDEIIEEAMQRALLTPLTGILEFDVDLQIGMIKMELQKEAEKDD